MNTKIGILSFHYIANNGAFLFAHSLQSSLQDEFSDTAIKLIDYKWTRLGLYEFLKRFRVLPGVPLFYYKRSKMWGDFLPRHLVLDTGYTHFSRRARLQQYFSDQYDAIIVGMDVWCISSVIERPPFPNIYWLPEKLNIPKFAYAVSAYNSDLSLIQHKREQIKNYLNDFDVIGSRDQFTHRMVQKYRTRSDGLVQRVPDPTFLFEIPKTGIAEKLSRIGVDLNRPILGLLLSGDDRLSKEIQSYYHNKGYQILALSMYNPCADYNSGHILNPFEWAEAFRLLSFCITDRYHGTIFCLKNNIPFISLEFDRHLSRDQSKLYDLLTSFDLSTCYVNPDDDNFRAHIFMRQAEEIEDAWVKSFKPVIIPKIQIIKGKHQDFIKKMTGILG